jgi:outer membrane protein TolC
MTEAKMNETDLAEARARLAQARARFDETRVRLEGRLRQNQQLIDRADRSIEAIDRILNTGR